MPLFKIIIIYLLAHALVGCNQDTSYSYLMQHPDNLQKEYDRCQKKTSPACDGVYQAAQDFSELVREQRYHPDQFVAEVMQIQQQLVLLKAALEQAKQADNTEKLTQLNTEYRERWLRLQHLYAALSLLTPH